MTEVIIGAITSVLIAAAYQIGFMRGISYTFKRLENSQ